MAPGVRIPRAVAAALAVAALAGATGCVYSPKGECDVSADCAAGQQCSAGVCMTSESTSLPGVDPTSFTNVTWSVLEGQADTRFQVDSVGADLAGNVVVGGSVDAVHTFGTSVVGIGAFVLRLDSGGVSSWAVPFPSFAHDRFETEVLPGGDVFFAGSAFDPTIIGTHAFIPLASGALILGRLDAAGNPVWVRAVDNTHASAPMAPVALAVNGTGDLLMAGTGSGDFGCASGDTASHTFAAALDGSDGSCTSGHWSRGFATRTISDVEVLDDGKVAVGGLCTPPAGASFDPGGGTTCAKGLFVSVLSDATTTDWARTSAGAGTVEAVSDLAVASDGTVTVVGDAKGVVDLGGGATDFGSESASFAVTFRADGAYRDVIRPIETPAAKNAMAFSRCAYDRTGRLWLAGRYDGQPTLGGIRFSACRSPACATAAFLARLETDRSVSSFLPLRAGPDADGNAFVDDLALFATTGTVAYALRFTGVSAAPAPGWTSAAGDLGVLRIAP